MSSPPFIRLRATFPLHNSRNYFCRSDAVGAVSAVGKTVSFMPLAWQYWVYVYIGISAASPNWTHDTVWRRGVWKWDPSFAERLCLNIQIVLRIESPKFHENIKTFGIASPMCGKGRIWVLHKSEPQFPAVGLPPSLSKGFPWGPRQASVESVDLIGKMKF